MRASERQEKRNFAILAAGAVLAGVLFLIWGQYNTAGMLFELGFLRHNAAEKLAITEGYTLSEAEQAVYDEALRSGDEWSAGLKPVEGSFQTTTVQRWFGVYSGIELGYRFYDQGAEQTVILLHGFQESPADARIWAPYWWEKGYNVLLPDQRSYSAEGVDNLIPTTYGVYEEFDLYDLILALGLQEETVLVHGRGAGAAAAILLSANPELAGAGLDGIIAESVYDDLGELQRAVVKEQFHLGDWFVGKFLRHQIKQKLGFDPDSVDLCAAAKNSAVPMLFLCGEADVYLSPSRTRAVWESCGAAKKELLSVSGAGHRLLWQQEGQPCQQEISRFLAD